MIFYFTFGPLYRLPSEYTGKFMSYGYSADKRKFCEDLDKLGVCEGAEDKKECEEGVRDIARCMDVVDSWLETLNVKCRESINGLEECIDQNKNCVAMLNELMICEENIDKPVWLSSEYVVHWNNVKKPVLQKRMHSSGQA